jgi:hypothetical protein
MNNSIRFVTYVDLSLGGRWQWTVPRTTHGKSKESAVNMVGARLLEDRGISISSNFSIRLRQSYPEIVKEARGYIGETREVVLEAGMTPKEFQRKFHEVGY